jgi:predicted nuclease of predicted toxin-antitoxin system
VRFLVDNALWPKIAEGLCANGYEAVHVREHDLQAAPDELIFERAAQEDRIIISADTDFATLLALRETRVPSLILFRASATHIPERQVALLLRNLPSWKDALSTGSIITVEATRVRARALPV